MSLPSATVVIPTFNSSATIKRALDSVFAQTVQPKQIIVVDNASTDSTVEVIANTSSAARHKVLLVRQDHNGGPGMARNAGWDLARTEFVTFLDSDDSWHPTKLEQQLKVALQHPDDCFFGHTTTVSTLTRDASEFLGSGRWWYFTLRHFLVRNRLSTPTVMLRTDLTFRFPTDHWYAEDYALWTQILAAGHRAVVLDLALTMLHKAPWGEAGLSAKLDAMHAGELLVLEALRQQHAIGAVEYTVFRRWMKLKYQRRLIQGRTRD